jgi:hypothetical protein
MLKLRVVAILGAAITLAGCGTQTAVVNLTTDQAVVDAIGNDTSIIEATGEQACAIHGREARWITQACADIYCIQSRVLFACVPPAAPSKT